MTRVLRSYVTSKKNLFEYFKCREEYPVVMLTENRWAVKETEGMYFLTYWTKDEERQFNYVVVKKDGEPLVYKTRDYSMVIAIDCIKTAFVFKNNE